MLVLYVRQLVAVLSKYLRHPCVQRQKHLFPRLLLHDTDILPTVTQLLYHLTADALVVTHTLSCQTAHDEDVTRYTEVTAVDVTTQGMDKAEFLLVILGEALRPLLHRPVVAHVESCHLVQTLLGDIHILHVLMVHRETAALEVRRGCQLHVLGGKEYRFQVLHMTAYRVRRVLLLDEETFQIVVEVQRHVIKVKSAVTHALILLQLCQRPLRALDGSRRNHLRALPLQSLARLTLSYILPEKVHQRHPLLLPLLRASRRHYCRRFLLRYLRCLLHHLSVQHVLHGLPCRFQRQTVCFKPHLYSLQQIPQL